MYSVSSAFNEIDGSSKKLFTCGHERSQIQSIFTSRTHSIFLDHKIHLVLIIGSGMMQIYSILRLCREECIREA